MPLCRGYCMGCKKIILGIDGWHCQQCMNDSADSKIKRSFALCLRCFSKSDADKPEHEHPYSEFRRFSISGIGKEKVDERLNTWHTNHLHSIVGFWFSSHNRDVWSQRLKTIDQKTFDENSRRQWRRDLLEQCFDVLNAVEQQCVHFSLQFSFSLYSCLNTTAQSPVHSDFWFQLRVVPES